MSTQPKITVVVPSFNAEKFLPRCIDSILQQDYTNFEIIIIDDGSTDKSASIYNQYTSQYSQVKVIKIRHSGVSKARNTGIKHASGEWITFVDSDDTINRTYLSLLASKTNPDCDLVIGRIASTVEKNTPQKKGNDFLISSLADKQQLCKSIFNPKSSRYPHTACSTAKLYRKSILKENAILFNTSLKFYEDAYFVMQYIMHTNSAYFCDKVIYKYHIRPNSTTQSYYPDIVHDYKITYSAIFSDQIIQPLYEPMDIYYLKTKDLNQILKNLIGLGWPYNEFKKTLTAPLFHQAINKVNYKNIPKLNSVMVILARLHLHKLLYLIYYLKNKITTK